MPNPDGGFQPTPEEQTEDLTTPEGVVALMESSANMVEWNENQSRVAKANGGAIPDFWFKEIVTNRVSEKAMDRWSLAEAKERLGK